MTLRPGPWRGTAGVSRASTASPNLSICVGPDRPFNQKAIKQTSPFKVLLISPPGVLKVPGARKPRPPAFLPTAC